MNRRTLSGIIAALALTASTPAIADQDRAAEDQKRLQLLGRHVLVVYGAVLCDTADDAIGIRVAMHKGMEIRPTVPCHASRGGWAELVRFNTGYGTGFVRFRDDGESGWVASVNGFITCDEYESLKFRIPNARPTPAFCH